MSNFPEQVVVDRQLSPILVVDNEPMIRDPLAGYLSGKGFACDTAGTGSEALHKLEAADFALFIADIRMPGFSGLELLDNLAEDYPDVAVIMITAVADVQTAVHTMKQGAYDYITKPFDLDEVLKSVQRALHLRLLRLEDQKVEENLQGLLQSKSSALNSALQDLKEYREITLETLMKALDARGHETQCHSQRVQAYSIHLAQHIGITRDQLTDLAHGALLHDIGKIGIPDGILLKAGPLTPSEWTIMKQHPVIGYEIVNGTKFLQRSTRVVLCHHERYDGKGYPTGLEGDEIPLEARIFSILDAYDAMTTDRPYRQALPAEAVKVELQKHSNSQFDPDVLQEFLKIPAEEWQLIGSSCE